MFRALLQAIFGHREKATEPPKQPQETIRWREVPNKTGAKDIGGGVIALVTLTTGPHGFVQVVGESLYQETLRDLAATLGLNGVFTARLVAEPDNSRDSNAVAVCIDDPKLDRVGYLSRQIARAYQKRILDQGNPVTCPARLTGGASGTIGVVLDFEEVREALGLRRIAIDQSEMDYKATAEYHRLNNGNRHFVKDTRRFEASDPEQAVARYRQALVALRHCRDFAREKGLERYGFLANQTDALPLDRLIRCLLKIGEFDSATTELDTFVKDFPHLAQVSIVQDSRTRIARSSGGQDP